MTTSAKGAADQLPPDEFAGIPSRRPRSVVLAVAAVAFAGFLAFRARQDVGYALSSPAPLVVGDAKGLAGRPADALPLNRYVRLSGLPDRESAVILDTSGSWKFSQFYRFLGTGNRVFVRRVPDPLSLEASSRDDVAGRLVRMSALSFDGSMRDHFAKHVASTHFFKPAVVVAALQNRAAGGGLSLVDTTGETVPLGAGDELVVDVWRPGQIRVDVPVDRFPQAAAFEERLRKLGATVVSKVEGKIETGGVNARHQIVVSFPDEAARDAAFAALDELDRRILVRQALASHAVKASALTAPSDGGLAVPGVGPVPLAQIAALRTTAPVAIPEDALLLIEGERPRDHMLTIGIVAVLCVFAAVNLLALRRAS